MKKLAVLLVLAVLLSSCKSGWSYKKRYVEVTKLETKKLA